MILLFPPLPTSFPSFARLPVAFPHSVGRGALGLSFPQARGEEFSESFGDWLYPSGGACPHQVFPLQSDLCSDGFVIRLG